MAIGRALRAVRNRLNARRLGVAGSLPPGSIVNGRHPHLAIGRGFFSSGPVWIDAVTAYDGVRFDPRIVIGEDVRTSPRLHVSSILGIRIGDQCLFGENVFVADHQHGSTRGTGQVGPEVPPALRPLGDARPVTIGDRCHLGNNVVVLPGAVIGEGSVIGANSVVSGEIPPHSIAVGAPARVVKTWDATSKSWRRVGAGSSE